MTSSPTTSPAPGSTEKSLKERILHVITEAYDIDDPAVNWDERCAIVGDLEAVKTLCGQLMDRLLTGLYPELPDWEMTFDFGTFTKSKGTKRKSWDHARAGAVVAARAADDYVENVPPAVLADHVMEELLACAGVSYWRAGEMRRRNLSVDDYCEKSEGTPTVIFKAVGG